MENLPGNGDSGQSHGYTLYETTITGGGTLNSRNNVRDRALVRVKTHTQHVRNIDSNDVCWSLGLFIQVFVDRQRVGCLDVRTQELALPDGAVLVVAVLLCCLVC